MLASKKLIAGLFAALMSLGVVACEVEDGGVQDPGTDPGFEEDPAPLDG